VAGSFLVGRLADGKIPRMRWVRIVPLLIMINTVSYIDRFNIGYAIVGGIGTDLKLSTTFTGFAAGVFSGAISSCNSPEDIGPSVVTPKHLSPVPC
jgi:hypothetical protein